MKKNHFTGRYKAFILFAMLFSGALLSCQEDEKDVVKPKTVTDIIGENERFSTLNEIIVGIKAQDAFRTTDAFTFFAPNNDAFLRAQITASEIIALPNDSARKFIMYHVLPQRYLAADLKRGKHKTLNGDSLEVQKGNDTTIVTINNHAVIVEKNINTDNGMIQVVDRLLTIKK